MREAGFCHWARDGVAKVFPLGYRFIRIETGATAPGTPDINYAFERPKKRADEGWIETKSVALPAKITTRVLGPQYGLSQEQINFHYAAARIRARSFVFVQADEWKWLVGNEHAQTVNDWSVEELCERSIMSVKGNWRAADWRDFIEALTK